MMVKKFNLQIVIKCRLFLIFAYLCLFISNEALFEHITRAASWIIKIKVTGHPAALLMILSAQCDMSCQRSLFVPSFGNFIRKTCPCNVYPLKPHFYTAKLGYAAVYLFFLFLLQNIDCGYSLEPPRRGGSNVYPQSMFRANIRKKLQIFNRKFSFLQPKTFIYIAWTCFRNVTVKTGQCWSRERRQ